MLIKTTPRKKLALDCLQHKLYVKGWSLRHVLHVIAVCPDDIKIAVAYENKVPIGVMIFYPWFSISMLIKGKKRWWAMCYVSKTHRRKGVGTVLFEHLTRKYKIDPSQLEHSKGKRGSISFFKALKIGRNDYRD